MPTGDPEQTTGNALHRLRPRWFAPSRPLAVDDEPQWQPTSDAADAAQGLEDVRQIVTAPAGKT